MSSEKLIKDSIESIEEERAAVNDAEKVVRSLSNKVLETAQDSIAQANATESIDKKIEILASAVSNIVAECEKELDSVIKTKLKYKNQIAY